MLLSGARDPADHVRASWGHTRSAASKRCCASAPASGRRTRARRREWLTDWLNNGLLALNAFQGYFHMPRMGSENIKRLLFAPDRSPVAMDLGAVLPERT